MTSPFGGESEPVEKAVNGLMEELLKSPEIQAKVRELALARVDAVLEKAVDSSLRSIVDRLFGYGSESSDGLRKVTSDHLNALISDGTTRGALETKVEQFVLDKIEQGQFVENWVGQQLTHRLSVILNNAVTNVAKKQAAKATRAAKAPKVPAKKKR